MALIGMAGQTAVAFIHSMPSLSQHCADCRRELGEPFEHVHEWLDALFKVMGPNRSVSPLRQAETLHPIPTRVESRRLGRTSARPL